MRLIVKNDLGLFIVMFIEIEMNIVSRIVFSFIVNQDVLFIEKGKAQVYREYAQEAPSYSLQTIEENHGNFTHYKQWPPPLRTMI